MNTIRDGKEINIPGYVLDAETLKRIDALCTQSFDLKELGSEQRVLSTFLVTDAANKDWTFDSVDALMGHLDTEPSQVQSISLKYFHQHSAINIVFDQKGRITSSAFGSKPNFQFNVDRLERVIHECDPEYGWPVRLLVFRDWIKRFLGWAFIAVSLILLALLGFYAYGRKVGVNVDPSIIPSGNTYYQDVERAIKSSETNIKLNVLLQGQLNEWGFENIRDILDRTKWQIALASLILIGISFLSLIRSRVVRLYPITFFAFGHQKQVLRRLQRKREIWLTAIVIAFIVNVIAGFLVAFSTR